MKDVRVVYNLNADLISALQEEGILPEKPKMRDVVGEGGDAIAFELFEGKNSWFIKVLPYEGSEEVVVPKDVSEETAMNIAKYLVEKSACYDYKDICKTDATLCKNDCKQEYNWCKNEYPKEECIEEYKDCLKECKYEEQECIEMHEINYCEPARKAELKIRKEGLISLGCINGIEENSPDIDYVCHFVMRY